MNNTHVTFYRRLACVLFAGFIMLPFAGCGGSSEPSVVEAASEEELSKTEAELSGVSEEEYEKGMNEL